MVVFGTTVVSGTAVSGSDIVVDGVASGVVELEDDSRLYTVGFGESERLLAAEYGHYREATVLVRPSHIPMMNLTGPRRSSIMPGNHFGVSCVLRRHTLSPT